MPSLRQLLALHPTLLVVDTCATRAEAAVWMRDHGCSAAPALAPVARAAVEGEASAALPVAVARVLAASGGLRIQNLDAAAFCAGPGSVLGVRLAAATLRAWRAVRPSLAVHAYPSLPLLALGSPPAAAGRAIIADARRDTWHATSPSAPLSILRIPTSELVRLGPLATPAGFRRWSALPAGLDLVELTYSVPDLLSAAPDADVFTLAAEPDAFMHETPVYVPWTPQIHHAPTSVR